MYLEVLEDLQTTEYHSASKNHFIYMFTSIVTLEQEH